MTVLRVLIVDDEPLARARLRALLADCIEPAAEVVGEAGSATAALQCLSQRRADVVLLDIHLPGQDGVQLAVRLRALARPPAVVFVTAHAEHALQAFEVEAVDYLTKPVRRARLQESLQRAARQLSGGAVWPTTMPAALQPELAAPVLVVQERGELIRVPVAEVIFLKAELKYVTLCTAQRSYLLDEPLAELEARLGSGFVRIHRNALVAVNAIRSMERRRAAAVQGGAEPDAAESWWVQVAVTGEWLAVSRRQLAQVREVLAQAGL
jgi:two-component system response regulator AlgR